jgi:hypothetical protein
MHRVERGASETLRTELYVDYKAAWLLIDFDATTCKSDLLII